MGTTTLTGEGTLAADSPSSCSTDGFCVSIFTLEANLKLVTGGTQINFRTIDRPYRAHYTLGFSQDGYYLNRNINEESTNLMGGSRLISYDRWYKLKVVLLGADIKIYIDDKLAFDYKDVDLPLIFGCISFNVAPNSQVFYDDINVLVH